MAIVFETFASGNNTADGNTVTVNKPTGTATGDVLVAVVGFWQGAATAGTITESAPSGWILVGKYPASGTETLGLAVWRKTITDGGGEPSTYDFGMDSSQAPDGSLAATIARFSGVDTTSPIDVAGTNNYASSLTVTFNGVTTSSANTMLVMCGANRRTLTYTFNNGTKIDDQSGGDSADASNTVSIGMGYLAQAGAGASGNKTATISGATPRENVGFMFALKEASGGLTITSVNTTNTAFSAQTDSAVVGTGLSASVVCTYAGIACTNESASSSTSLKITFPNFFTNNIKLGRNYEFKVVG